MLILTRKLNESIIIGDDVRVMVTHIDSEHVRLGITAPDDTEVHREEIWCRIHEAERWVEP